MIIKLNEFRKILESKSKKIGVYRLLQNLKVPHPTEFLKSILLKKGSIIHISDLTYYNEYNDYSNKVVVWDQIHFFEPSNPKQVYTKILEEGVGDESQPSDSPYFSEIFEYVSGFKYTINGPIEKSKIAWWHDDWTYVRPRVKKRRNIAAKPEQLKGDNIVLLQYNGTQSTDADLTQVASSFKRCATICLGYTPEIIHLDHNNLVMYAKLKNKTDVVQFCQWCEKISETFFDDTDSYITDYYNKKIKIKGERNFYFLWREFLPEPTIK